MPARTTVAAIALGSGLLVTRAFVPGVQAPVAGELTQPQALRGAAAGTSTASGAAEGSATLVGFAAATVLTATAVSRRQARTALRAEPISAAAAGAAAAAAAKAAGATAGAVKTGAAVAGSATTGSMKQAADARPDDSLADEPLNIKDRGTPKYEAIKAAKAARKEKDWEVRTARNPDGNFGNQDDAYKGKANLYDPLMSLSDQFLEEAGEVFDPAFQIGATAPLGFFDPLGFCKKGDEKAFRNYRAAEIKHGRVAMMAALGAVVQHFVKFPGFEGVPSGLGAANTAPGSYGFVALFAVAGALELGPWSESEGKAPGDFGDPVGLNQYNEDTRNRELNNGRFAMFAAIGIIAAELYTGKDAIEQFA